MCVQVCDVGEWRGGRKPDFFKEHRHSSSTSREKLSLGQDLTCSSIMSSALPEVSCFTLVCTKHRGKTGDWGHLLLKQVFLSGSACSSLPVDTTLSTWRYFCLPPLWHLSSFIFVGILLNFPDWPQRAFSPAALVLKPQVCSITSCGLLWKDIMLWKCGLQKHLPWPHLFSNNTCFEGILFVQLANSSLRHSLRGFLLAFLAGWLDDQKEVWPETL